MGLISAALLNNHKPEVGGLIFPSGYASLDDAGLAILKTCVKRRTN